MINGLFSNGEIIGGNMESGLMGGNLIRNKPSENVFTPIKYINGDPYIDNVILYLKGDDYVDSSPNPQTAGITPNSSAAFSTDIKKYGVRSFDFRVTNSNLSIANLGGLTTLTNTTIEFWGYLVSNSDKGILQFNNLTNAETGKSIRFYSATQLNYWGNTQPVIVPTIPINSWVHFAFVHTLDFLTVYINGTQVATRSRSHPTLTAGHNLILGTYYNSSYFMRGYMDSFRITNAVRYTADFDPENDTYLAY